MDSQGKKLFIFKGKSGILYNLVTSCLIWGLVWLSHQKLFPPSVPHPAPSLYKAHITSWSLIQNEQELHKSFLQSYPSTVFIPSYCYRMPLDLKGYTLEKYTKKKKMTFWQLKYQHEWMVLNCPENYTLQWKWFNHSLAFTSNLAV